MNFQLILPLLVQTVVVISIRKIHNSWIHPGVFFPLLWLLYSIGPLLFASDYYIQPYGLWIITLFISAVGLGSLLSTNAIDEQATINKNFENSFKDYKLVLFIAVFITSIFAFIGAGLVLGFTMNRFQLNFSIFNLLMLPNEISVDRYLEILDFPIHIKFFRYWLFPASLLAGLAYPLARKIRESFLCFLPLIIAILFGLMETSRFTIITTVVIWYAGVLGARIVLQENLNKFFDKRSKRFFLFASTLFVGLFILLDWLRQAQGELVADLVLERLKAYLFGYLAAFSNWVTMIHDGNIQFGQSTFAGPLSLTGIVERKFGSYGPILIAGDLSTNIYTALRGLIMDFSILGTGMIMILIGWFGSITYQNVMRGKLFFLIPLTLFYAFTLYSPLISIFHYNSLIMSWVILAAFFLLAKPIVQNSWDKDGFTGIIFNQ